MASPITTESADGVTTIVMDDGKTNALSFEMFLGSRPGARRLRAGR